MSLVSDDWPGIAEELARKGNEVLGRWMDAYEKGEITATEFRDRVSGLYDTVSGLAARDFTDLLASFHRELSAEANRA